MGASSRDTIAPMSDAPTMFERPAPTEPVVVRPHTRGRAVLEVVAFSLATTAASAALALVAALVADVRWSIAFVVLRWLIVAALVATPLIHQAARRFGATWTMAYALRTPATAVLLTCESIAFDILSARLG
ncbi:MAG: hypothetical protein JWN72_1659 [Thermoleophilia bacterium]|nr:hypothetical protein [Thermoleophilia bacterium]